MGGIRKYKVILAAFLTLVFVVYTNHAPIAGAVVSIDKPERHVLKQDLGFFSCTCFYKLTKVKEPNSNVLKKAAFDKSVLKLFNNTNPLLSENYSRTYNYAFSGTSILKLICLQRI